VYIDRKLPVGVSVSEYIIGVEFLCNEYTVEQVFYDKFLYGKLYTRTSTDIVFNPVPPPQSDVLDLPQVDL
jgi:hypothetical protein